MSRPALLPAGLLDLTYAKFAARCGLVANAGTPGDGRYAGLLGRRYLQQLALRERPPTPHHGANVAESYPSHRRRRVARVDATPAIRAQEQPMGVEIFSELERRVEELKNIVVAEETSTALQAYSEDDLLAVYEDLLALPTAAEDDTTADPALQSTQLEKDRSTIFLLEERLRSDEADQTQMPNDSPLADALRRRRANTTANSSSSSADRQAASSTAVATSQSVTRSVLARLVQVTQAIDAAQALTVPVTDLSMRIPLGLVGQEEWEALVRVSCAEQDADAMENALSLMKQNGAVPSEEVLNEALSLHAEAGNVERTEQFITQFIGPKPSQRQRDLHIKAHVCSYPRHALPENALSLLHHYESRNLPAPMKTYTRLISALFSVRPSSSLPSPPPASAATIAATPLSSHSASVAQAHAQAWDLFAHMRYVAHPNPDAHLYTLMIRACALQHAPFLAASISGAEPERALDLWTEMTVDRRISPTRAAYAAVVRVCARSGRREYVAEAFRLARAMIDARRDARGRAEFAVGGAVCRALLDGAKRVGELGRVRWILAEMVKEASGTEAAEGVNGSERGEDDDPVVVDEEVMMHVFHAYASYRPPFKRAATNIVDAPSPGTSEVAGGTESTGAPAPAAEAIDEPSPVAGSIGADADEVAPLAEADSGPAFAHLAPQSRAEVLHEAQFLFRRILAARPTSPSPQQAEAQVVESTDRAFRTVQLTPRLLNAFLSVHYRHAALDACAALWRRLPGETGGARNARSYVEALERCAGARRGRDRDIAIEWGQELWREWESAERAWAERREEVEGVDARLVERANAAMIRLLALTNNVPEAVAHLRSFVARYPPDALRTPPPVPAMRAPRVVLAAPKPLVRLTSATEVPDERVPPLLTFADLEIVHHRLAAAGDARGVRHVMWVCKAYEGALRARRDAAMRAPVESAGKGESGASVATR